MSKNRQDQPAGNREKKTVKKEKNIAAPDRDMEIGNEFTTDKKDTKKKK